MSSVKQENGFLNILINVIVPVLILNKLTEKMGPAPALLLALAFPLGYGLYDFKKRHKMNWFSLLGLLNVMVTGGLALLGLSGIWFAIKEAAFPFLIGIFVLLSAYTTKPFVETLLLNPQLMDVEKLQQKLHEKNTEGDFKIHLRTSTQLLSASFFLSSALNFILAKSIFTPLDVHLDEMAKSVLLNEQIAKMTSYSLAVIMLPSLVFLVYILWHLLSGIHKLTGLKTDEILKNP